MGLQLHYVCDPERALAEFPLEGYLERSERLALTELHRLLAEKPNDPVDAVVEGALWECGLNPLRLDLFDREGIEVSRGADGICVHAEISFVGAPLLWLFWPGVAPAPVVWAWLRSYSITLFGYGAKEQEAKDDLQRNIETVLRLLRVQGKRVSDHRAALKRRLLEVSYGYRRTTSFVLH